MSSLKMVCVACLLAGAAGRTASGAAPPTRRSISSALTVSELQQKMAAGQLTSVQLTRAYINRIAAVNARGPGINAVRIVNPRALQDAALLDLERATGHVRGPLHGIPVLVKDNLDVAGLPDHRGQRRAAELASRTATPTVVAKLRAAGAVILGKTNLTEFANFMTTGMPNGYSSLGGQVLNPYDIDAAPSGPRRLRRRGGRRPRGDHDRHRDVRLDRQPVGDAGRRRPAARRSASSARTGILPISATQDTAGPDHPHGRRRRGRAAGDRRQGPRGPGDRPAPATVPDYLAALTTDRAGRQAHRRHQQHQRAVPGRDRRRSRRSARRRSRSRRRRPAAPFDILTPEFKRDLNAYLGRLPASAPMKSLADIIAYNTAHADEALKFGQTPAHRQPGDRPQRPGARTPPTSPPATASAPPPAPRSTTR